MLRELRGLKENEDVMTVIMSILNIITNSHNQFPLDIPSLHSSGFLKSSHQLNALAVV